MTGTEFNPDYTFTEGKSYIVSLILPNVATSIASGGDYYITESTFRSFYYLTHIRGTNIEEIGKQIFASSRLRIADFPKVRTIGSSVFTSTTLTITMGTNAPHLSKGVFIAFSDTSYTVTVKVPSEATGYSPFTGTSITVSGDNNVENWANGFRGGGWVVNQFVDGASINSNISLTIEQQ
jgi:hypothetical protein